jgi:hypothetical protein
LNLNPHPLKDEGAAPNCRSRRSNDVRTCLFLGADGDTTEGHSRSQSPSEWEKECGKME